jgi:hypothetical protein
MKANLHRCYKNSAASVLGVSALLLLMVVPMAHAQPTLVSSVPANLATGVSPSASVVFTFSESMDTANTSAQFLTPPSSFLATTPSWSSNNTVLTCSPTPPFPANTSIVWIVTGQNPGGMALSGNSSGFFQTGGGSGGGGITGTNAITLFNVEKFYFYRQTNSSPPAVTNATLEFDAGIGLTSNQVATAGMVTLPGASVSSNLNQNALGPENFYLFDYTITNQTTFENTYLEGGYQFSLTAKPSNLQVTVTLPASMVQPNPPFISNYDAAQNVNAAQPFALTWGAFLNGTSSDAIVVSIAGSSGLVFATPGFGSNFLKGTVTSVTIPAGTLAANSFYSADLFFYRFVAATNATYVTFAARGSGTQFSISTAGGVSLPPTVSNPTWTASGLGVDVGTSPNQVLNALFSTDCSLPISQWHKILTTNSPGTAVHITVPIQPGTVGFVRLQNGP